MESGTRRATIITTFTVWKAVDDLHLNGCGLPWSRTGLYARACACARTPGGVRVYSWTDDKSERTDEWEPVNASVTLSIGPCRSEGNRMFTILCDYKCETNAMHQYSATPDCVERHDWLQMFSPRVGGGSVVRIAQSCELLLSTFTRDLYTM